jgi:NTP pyrophosphatase (non-canonical NTP hydrolase)
MNIQNLQSFISQVHEKLINQNTDLTPMEKQLCMFTKLSEEVGELSRAVLGFYKRQREGDDRDPIGEIGPECADVIFAAMMIAKSFDIDIAKELEKKQKKIEERF